jgi:glucokinase
VTLAAGVDVGGTKCLGVVLADGEVVREVRAATPTGADAVVATVVAVAAELQPYDRLGVGVPGLVTRRGVLRAAPNLPGVFELDVQSQLEHRLDHPVIVENDATGAMLAEWRLGAARSARDAALVTLGTGIGAGFVVDGRLLLGANGFAGEPGHMVVDPNGPVCVCGQRGCWERYASGSGLAALAEQAVADGRLTAAAGGSPDEPESVRGEHVEAAARRGDEGALAVLDRFAWWIALGLVNLTNLLDPEIIVIGGGVTGSLDLVLPSVDRHLRQLLYAAAHRPVPHLASAALGERAGAIGAALLDSS